MYGPAALPFLCSVLPENSDKEIIAWMTRIDPFRPSLSCLSPPPSRKWGRRYDRETLSKLTWQTGYGYHRKKRLNWWPVPIAGNSIASPWNWEAVAISCYGKPGSSADYKWIALDQPCSTNMTPWRPPAWPIDVVDVSLSAPGGKEICSS